MRRLLVALVWLVPRAATADDDARTRVSVTAGLGADSTVFTDGCGISGRETVGLEVMQGQHRRRLLFGLGVARLAVPSAYCDYDQSWGDASAFETRMTVGEALVGHADPVFAFVSAVAGIEYQRLHTHSHTSGELGDPDDDRSETTGHFGPLIEFAGGFGVDAGQFTGGVALTLGAAVLKGDPSLGWEAQPGLQLSVRVFVGVDL